MPLNSGPTIAGIAGRLISTAVRRRTGAASPGRRAVTRQMRRGPANPLSVRPSTRLPLPVSKLSTRPAGAPSSADWRMQVSPPSAAKPGAAQSSPRPSRTRTGCSSSGLPRMSSMTTRTQSTRPERRSALHSLPHAPEPSNSPSCPDDGRRISSEPGFSGMAGGATSADVATATRRRACQSPTMAGPAKTMAARAALSSTPRTRLSFQPRTAG